MMGCILQCHWKAADSLLLRCNQAYPCCEGCNSMEWLETAVCGSELLR